jgi:AcrR family transcriptional regulator
VRAAVLEATLDELAERSYAGMSIPAIADRAGVHRTSLYRRWGSKGALVAEALLAGPEPDELPPLTGNPRADLLQLWATAPTAPGSRDIARSIAIARALAAAGTDPEVAAIHRRLWKRRMDLMRAIVDAAIATGELPDGADPSLLTDLLFGPFYSRVIARNATADTTFLTQVMEAGLAAVGARS